jgi:hypothetical protein
VVVRRGTGTDAGGDSRIIIIDEDKCPFVPNNPLLEASNK